jgi:hypothetical protein
VYCAQRAVCEGQDATLPDAQCQARCQLSDTVHNFAQCAAFAFDCDGYYTCTHGDYGFEHPEAVAVFPADYTYTPGRCLGPLPEENGHMLGVRLQPPAYPFRVDAIEYVVMQQAAFGFDAGLAHSVEVWTQNDRTPLENPGVVGSTTLNVPATVIAEDRLRRVRLPLARPITLQDGDVMFVGVHLAYDAASGRSLCVAGGADADLDESFWWSGAAQPPYAWTSLTSMFIADPFAIFALGTAL